MSIHRNDLIMFFNTLLSSLEFEDYGPNGLQIEGKEWIKKVAFSVSATQESLHKAASWNADALIVHHGVLWKHQGARPITGAWGKRIKMAIEQDLNLMAYHLPLDAHLEIGTAAALAKKLNIENLQAFGTFKKKNLGAKGKLQQPLKVEDFKILMEKTLNHPVIMASSNTESMIESVGIITGGANHEWTFALEDQLDAYVTGEISEYNWHDAKEAGIHFFSGGHHATEKFGVISLMEYFKSKKPDCEVLFIDSLNPA
jgi:dinuclear metal center YbgI/SA1388 family protein